MIIDLFDQLAAAQAFTSGTTLFTNVKDLTAVDPDIGAGEPMGIQITVDVAADFTTMDETYEFQVLDDDDPALGSPVIIARFPIVAGLLTAGDKHFLPFPSGVFQQRYLGAQAVLAGTTPTITISADIRPQSMSETVYRNYPIGYTIS